MPRTAARLTALERRYAGSGTEEIVIVVSYEKDLRRPPLPVQWVNGQPPTSARNDADSGPVPVRKLPF